MGMAMASLMNLTVMTMVMALLMTSMTMTTMMASLTTWTFLVMRGNGNSDLDLDLLFSAWSFWFVTANLKRSFTRKEKPKKKRKKRKKLKQNKHSHSLDRKNDRAGGQKSSLKELLTTRMADFSTVFIQPKFFCENHTRQKLFYISSYVKFLVKIILMSLKQDLNMDFVLAISLLPIPTSSIISVVQLIQAKKNREITTGNTWQHPKLTSNPALDKVESDAK